MLLPEGGHLSEPLLKRRVLPVQRLEESGTGGAAQDARPCRAAALAVVRKEHGERLVLLDDWPFEPVACRYVEGKSSKTIIKSSIGGKVKPLKH